ncbi:MAG TPA: hypothetical protein VID77_00450 [Stellaceae bacterium]
MTEGTTMERDDGGSIARAIYILYLAGLLVGGITSIIGLVMAYVYRDGAPHWLRTHYHYQIRTFWIGLLYAFIGGITTFIFVGWFILVFWLFWYIIRCVKGLKLASEGSAVPNAATWLF